MRRKTPMAKGPGPKRSGRIRPKKRTAGEFSRIYGSKARVQWVKSQPCLVCGFGPCENAHVVSGGMGRKADANTIVPLCRDHHWQSHHYGWDVMANRWGREDFRLRLAADVQTRWERYAEGE